MKNLSLKKNDGRVNYCRKDTLMILLVLTTEVIRQTTPEPDFIAGKIIAIYLTNELMVNSKHSRGR